MPLLIAALERLWRVEVTRIGKLALGREGYTAAQYADAAVMLLDAKHHAVPERVMQARLGRHEVGAAASEGEAVAAGERVFLRLVEVNALSMRPKSGAGLRDRGIEHGSGRVYR